MIDPQIFHQLKESIEEDSARREAIRDVVKELEQQNRETWFGVSEIHQLHSNEGQGILRQKRDRYLNFVKRIRQSCQGSVAEGNDLLKRLEAVANKSPYYRYNNMWTKDLQELIFHRLLLHWVGTWSDGEYGELLTLEDVGRSCDVPINIRDEDAFHITIEDYLHATITLIDELSRLATNSVIVGDFERPLRISQFVQSVYNGFRILNLKNDRLRQRYDGLKYQIKRIENVVYDLKLRGLAPERDTPAEPTSKKRKPADDSGL